MNVFIINIIIHCSLAHYIPKLDIPNVGTVLFTHSDLDKAHWSKSNIALLQARKYVQNIIPSPMLTHTINEDYLTSLLKYFENSYSTVKREIRNPSLRNMMDIALSDVLGGYLKIFVLPITKYAYYGGTISLDNSLRIFEAYDDIKRNLNTDGRGWHSPNENLLKSVAINIVSLPYYSKKSMENPCKQLAYYEKSDTGVKIPLPVINWEISPPTMFVPLANQSIVSLSAPNSSSTLIRYFKVADCCMQSQCHQKLSDDFYNRFQAWLSHVVSPHLNDDKLYVAFGSVLSLMNKTRKFYDEQLDNLKCNVIPTLREPLTVFSKKFLILALILIIEFVWCIPTIVFIVRSGKTRRQKGTKGSFTVSNKQKSSKASWYKRDKNVNRTKEGDSKQAQGLKFFVKPRTASVEADVQFPPTQSKNMITNKSRHASTLSNSGFTYTDLVTLVNEKSPSKMIFPEFNTTKAIIENSKIKSRQSKNLLKTKIDERNPELNLTKTITLINNDEKAKKEARYTKRKQVSNQKINCSCIKDRQNENSTKARIMNPMNNEPRQKREKFKNKENVKKAMPNIVNVPQTTTVSKKRTLPVVDKLEDDTCIPKNSNFTSDEPVLRILIERPQDSIKVGITSYKGNVTPATTSKIKPSRIPRAVKCSKETKNEVVKPDSIILDPQKNTKRVVVRGKALDDSTIKQTSMVNKKLNITL